PSYFIKISQSEIVNLKEIERFNITPNGLVEIHLKNKETTYSSRRYLKAIKEKLQ
ncbi:MAG: LytTR family transcriptional regulator DNA-binding domain-containing protein, partial [Streptococcus sp.]|nr:LytTR family transcriptional regulator DNA-binding domain-containing protein [Streptococcus sp.]